MKRIIFAFALAVLFAGMLSFTLADENANLSVKNNSADISTANSVTSNLSSNNVSDSSALQNRSKEKEKQEKRDEKAAEMKKQAEEKIAEVKSKLAVFKEKAGNESTRANNVAAQVSVLLNEAKKLFDKENYFASLSTAKAAEHKLISVGDNKKVEEGKKILEQKEKVLQEREKKLSDWEAKLNERISKLEEKLNRLESFAKLIEKYNGHLNVEGKNITIRAISNEKKEIAAGKINAKLGLNLTGEDIGENVSVIAALLSNGKSASVKVMPDRASLIALEKLRAKCADQCKVELKEVGSGEKTRPAYVIETQKNSKMFFIFPNKMAVKAEVDAETGQVLKVSKPWWSFLAKEAHATEGEIRDDTGVEENISG